MPGVDLNYFIRQANKLTEKIEKRKQELAEVTVEKKSANDLITVKVSCSQELKSLKMYLGGYRNEGIYYEAVTNRILDDLVTATKPRSMMLEGRFGVRGGISSVVTASFDKAKKGRG